MDKYIEIVIRKDPEFGENQVMSALFQKLHRALVRIEAKDIGVSFPQFKDSGLGSSIRLHGADAHLSKLMKTDWLAGMADYVKIADVSSIPNGCKYRMVKRVQAKTSCDRLRRRAMKRHKLDESAAIARIPNLVAQKLDLPFLHVSSESTQQAYRLFIDHGPLQKEPISGVFSSYGLSSNATIPWF